MRRVVLGRLVVRRVRQEWVLPAVALGCRVLRVFRVLVVVAALVRRRCRVGMLRRRRRFRALVLVVRRRCRVAVLVPVLVVWVRAVRGPVRLFRRRCVVVAVLRVVLGRLVCRVRVVVLGVRGPCRGRCRAGCLVDLAPV